jgi:hypothetical protein
MGHFTVQVGGFYVNESKGLVHEITQQAADGRVYWRSYELRTGKAMGDSLVCSPERIIQWADREATPEEEARMDRGDAWTKQIERTMAWVDRVLKEVPDEHLFEEVRRRGRQVI